MLDLHTLSILSNTLRVRPFPHLIDEIRSKLGKSPKGHNLLEEQPNGYLITLGDDSWIDDYRIYISKGTDTPDHPWSITIDAEPKEVVYEGNKKTRIKNDLPCQRLEDILYWLGIITPF